LLGHALPRVLPDAQYATPRRGGGVWAPAIQFHNGRFLIYYPDPDHGIFVVSATDPAGPWTAPQLVDATPGAIDPAPFWDEDGTGWLVHAYALSRAGQANRIVLKRLDPTGTKTLGPGQVIIDGDTLPPVQPAWDQGRGRPRKAPSSTSGMAGIIFAPSGSVKGGWQGVFRSRSITGPYEGRDVMDQGHTAINGPHQGPGLHPEGRRLVPAFPGSRQLWPGRASVNPCDGVPAGPSSAEILMATVAANLSRNIAFREQAEGPCSPRRARHWPTMIFREARSHQSGSLAATRSRIGPASTMAGCISSRSAVLPISENGAVLSQRLPAFAFVATTHMRLAGLRVGERAGLAIHGTAWAWIGLEQRADGPHVVRADKTDPVLARRSARAKAPCQRRWRVVTAHGAAAHRCRATARLHALLARDAARGAGRSDPVLQP
jgi:hypothetical protein